MASNVSGPSGRLRHRRNGRRPNLRTRWGEGLTLQIDGQAVTAKVGDAHKSLTRRTTRTLTLLPVPGSTLATCHGSGAPEGKGRFFTMSEGKSIIRIKRGRQYRDVVRRYKVIIDGHQAGTIRNDETVDFLLILERTPSA